MSGQRRPPAKPFDPTWTPALAWVVGIIATDGCLYGDGRHVAVVSKDRALLETVMRCLGWSVRVSAHRSGFGGPGPYYRIQLARAGFYRWLQEIGLTPNKSKIIGTLAIPDEVFRDFLRGCFDGDGSCYAYRDPRWPKSYLFYWELCSGSPTFIKWVRQRIQEFANLHGHISRGGGAEILKYAKREATVLFEKMYADREAPCLLRKREKVDQIMRTWRNLVHAQG